MSIMNNLFGDGGRGSAMQGTIDDQKKFLNSQNQANQSALNSHDWRNRLAASNELRQDANDYENNRAIQAGLGAYGGDPLSGGARTSVMDRLQQMNRANYQTSLNNANNMLGTDLNNQLAANNAHTSNMNENFNAQLGKDASKQNPLMQGIGNVSQMAGLAGKIMAF